MNFKLTLKIAFFFFFLVQFFHLNGQNSTSFNGTVKDGGGNPIEFATVFLSKAKNADALYEGLTDQAGKFTVATVAEGEIFLSISFVGFATIDTVLQMKQDDNNFIFTLEEQEYEAATATVSAKRKLVQRKIDRLVFDVENSFQTSQGDALEVLRVTPGVKVQNDQISMLGKSTVAVMIDDKIVQLPTDDLANYLKSIPSETIKTIEVITTPPAKYEAAGNSGLINIRLKKAASDSWNALIRAGYWQRTFANGNGGVNFNFNKNKWSISNSIFYRTGKYQQEQDDYTHFPDGLWYTSSPFVAKVEGFNQRFDLTYQLRPNWSIGTQYVFNRTGYSVTDAPLTEVTDYDNQAILQTLQSVGDAEMNPTIHSWNVNSATQLDTFGKSLTINLDYFIYNNPDTKNYRGSSVIANPNSTQFYQGTNTNDQEVTNMSATVDMVVPLKLGKLEFGGKINQSTSNNAIDFFNSGLVNEAPTDFVLANTDFEYTENVAALYLSFNRKLSKKWELQLGLRAEATQTESTSDNSDFLVKNDYTKLFPTCYLAHSINDHSSINLNYSKRIGRPNFFDLNPNTYFVNPFQTISGNPFLQPAFTDNVELSYRVNNLTANAYFSYEDDAFAQVPLPNSDNNLVKFVNENYINTQRYGASVFYIYNKIAWWSSTNSVDVNYAVSEFTLPQPQDEQKGINSRISTSNNFVLNAAKTWYLNVSYSYSFPGINGIYDTKSMSNFSVGLNGTIAKNFRVSMRANDLFKTQAERWTTTVNGVFQEARYYYDSRSVYVSLAYSFGNKNIAAKRHQTGNKEEKSRTGN